MFQMFHRNSSTEEGIGYVRFTIFFLLYFVQGIPYGLQSRYFPILFRMNGMDLAQVGMFKLLMLPWILRPMWALLVDAYFTRKFWLNTSLLVLCLLCIMTSFITPAFVIRLSVLMFLFNIATSIQDIALDSVVIDTLTPSQLALGNIAQVVGYKCGGLFSGGIFSLLSDIVSWEKIFLTLSATYVLGFLISLLFLIEENNTSSSSSIELINSSNGEGRSDIPRGDDIVVGTNECYMSNLFKTEGTIWMSIFIFLFKLGEIGATTMYPMFMIDNGISPHMTGFWTAFTGQTFSVIGSTVGGLLDSRKMFSNLTTMLLARGIFILVIFLGILMSYSFTSLSQVISVLALQGVFLTGGAMTTITYTLAMTLSQKASRRCRASHYTIMSTCDVLGRLLFAPIIGGMTQFFGYSIAFAFFTIAGFLIMLMLSNAPRSIR